MKTVHATLARELALVGLTALLSTACGGGGNPTSPPVPAPAIAVTDSIAPTGDHLLSFGGAASGSTRSRTATEANAGDAALVLGAVASANPLASPFSITADGCSGQTLAPAATCTVTVRFAPGASGSFNDAFDIPIERSMLVTR